MKISRHGIEVSTSLLLGELPRVWFYLPPPSISTIPSMMSSGISGREGSISIMSCQSVASLSYAMSRLSASIFVELTNSRHELLSRAPIRVRKVETRSACNSSGPSLSLLQSVQATPTTSQFDLSLSSTCGIWTGQTCVNPGHSGRPQRISEKYGSMEERSRIW